MAKKSTKNNSKAKVKAVPSRTNVSIQKAKNGFVVSGYDDKSYKDTVMIAKNKKEAQGFANKMLGLGADNG